MDKTTSFLKLYDDAINILGINWKNNYTIPSKNLYPHQWSWDSGWIIYGYCALKEEDKAIKEINSLFKYQWDNGLIPSIVFHDLKNNTYWPGPDYWELENKADHLTDNFTCTGIVQPPIHSSACLKIYEINNNKIFLENIFDKLLKWHKYLYFERDIKDEGLVFIRHPWESGMDNSTLWDESLNRIKIDNFKYSSLRTDNKKVNADERPTDITYERYMRLIELFKECNYNEKLIYKKSEFIVQDVLFNILLLKSTIDLLEIATIIDRKNDINLINYWIQKTKKGFNKLFVNDFYYNYDMKKKKHIKIKTISGLSSILLLDKKEIVIKTLKDKFLCLHDGNYSISSLERDNPDFDPVNYWRGPTWINLSWLIINGLEQNNHKSLADKIKKNCISKIKKIGFFEYFDSTDTDNDENSGCGDNSFSWTAAMLVCMVNDLKL